MRLDIANAAWQLGGDAALVKAVARGDVAAYCECRDRNDRPIRVGRILGAGYRTLQTLTSGAAAGCALAIKVDGPVTLARGRTLVASLPGHGVQQRDIREGVLLARDDVVIETHLLVVHNPLLSTHRQDDAVRSVKRRVEALERRARRLHGKRVVRWAVVGDFNMGHAEMARRIGAPHSRGVEVMGFVYSQGWHDVDLHTRRLPGSDHPVLTINAT